MKLKSILIFVLIVIMLATVVPLIVMCLQMLFDSRDLDDTWLGQMIAKM